MQSKRFIAPDMRRCLAMIREDLGNDAMILSTQRNGKGVEIIAATESVAAENTHSKAGMLKGGDAQVVKPTAPATTISKMFTQSSQSAKPQQAMSQNLSSGATEEIASVRGLASGKTNQELALELEQARQRMLALQKEDKMTLSEWADQQMPTPKVAPDSLTRARDPSSPEINQLMNDSLEVLRAEIDRFKQHSSRQQHSETSEIIRLQDEILTMRSFFENHLTEMAEAQERHLKEFDRAHLGDRAVMPMINQVRQRLMQLGLSQNCNDHIIASLKQADELSGPCNADRLWREAIAYLMRKLPVMSHDPVANGGVYTFLGTTGVGKTTTIAKLATRYVMENGPEQLALVTTDTFRLAAHDQLRSLGRILNVSVKVVDRLNQLPEVLEQLSERALVFIDTPGMNCNDDLLQNHIAVLRRCRGVQNVLVLSASSQYQMMQASMHSYRQALPKFSVMTKLDECAGLGDALSVLTSNRLPLAYVTDGQSVPDDLSQTNAKELMRKALALAKFKTNVQTYRKATSLV